MFAQACKANPDHAELGARADYLGMLPKGRICCVQAVELVHTSRVGVYRSIGNSHQDKHKYVNSAWLSFCCCFFFSTGKKKVTPVQKVPCLGRSEHVGFVVRNKPAMILYLGEYLKTQSGRILQIN